VWALTEQLYKTHIETLKTSLESEKQRAEQLEKRAVSTEQRLQQEGVKPKGPDPEESFVGLTSNDEGGSEPFVKIVNLRIVGNKADGEGTGSRGQSWSYSGYLNSGHLVLAYRSTKAGKTGFGVYWMEERGVDGTLYVGQAVGNHCVRREHPVVMRCNAVFVRGFRGGDEEKAARRDYKDYLATPCVDDHPAVNIPKELCD
jgi:hypothetical protein